MITRLCVILERWCIDKGRESYTTRYSMIIEVSNIVRMYKRDNYRQ